MLLEVDNLSLDAVTRTRPLRLVDGVSLSLDPRQVVALVGESGCGKSLTALALLRLLPPGVEVSAGRVGLCAQDVLRLAPPDLRRLRGNRAAMIFQDPLAALNPFLTAGEQVAEPLRTHRGLGRRAARQRAVELLRDVGIADAPRRCDAYPHELSGGMRQRVMIAMALACEPDLLIADEPTTALDATVQAQILTLLGELNRSRGMSMLLITHDLGIAAAVADRVCVMYSGRIVEDAPAAAFFAGPRHPYSRALLAAAEPAPRSGRTRLPVIAGEPPSPAARPPGCAFHPRCDRAALDARCAVQTPELEPAGGDHRCACWQPVTM